MRPSLPSIITIAGGALGFAFAGVSTYDFAAHLDRQVHGVHCSFLPGLGPADVSGATGCHVTLMSPYSSVFRDSLWGGIPISLPAMGVFAFLVAYGLFVWLTGRERDRTATGFGLAAATLPLLTSMAMGYIAVAELDAVCKLCAGIYVSSALVFFGALFLFMRAGSADFETTVPGESPAPVGGGALTAAFVVGLLFVALPVGAYAASAPDFDRFVGACGELASAPNDDVLVSLGGPLGGVDVIEILDPLCPACKGFEQRFEAQKAAEGVRRRALLFPLDSECNWMVDSRIHPGACAVSEAVLCAGDRAAEVIDWAFENQAAVREAETQNPGAAARMTAQAFPALAACMGTPRIKARLNLGLRWTVDSRMPVLTPQVYVGGRRMCDEDTDLGMDWALTRLIEKARTEGPYVPPARAATPRLAAPTGPAPARRAAPELAPAPAPVPDAAPAPVPAPEAAPAPAPAPAPEAAPEASPTPEAAYPEEVQ